MKKISLLFLLTIFAIICFKNSEKTSTVFYIDNNEEDIITYNDDIIANISIPGTKLNEYVLKSNNSYYSNNNVEEDNDYNTIFIDEKYKITDKIIKLYIKFSKNNSSRNFLKQYFNEKYFIANNKIILKTENGTSNYSIFSVCYVEDDYDIDYIINNSIYKKTNIDKSKKMIILEIIDLDKNFIIAGIEN